MARPVLRNDLARRLFLHRHALGGTPTGSGKGDDLSALITQLGFVQLDSINTVQRAHHMILRTRRAAYKPSHLKRLQEQDRGLFEHWTHDAAVVPMAFFPHWNMRCARDAEMLKHRYRKRSGLQDKCDEVLRQVSEHGPVSSSTVGVNEPRSSGGWWEWHPSKTALEYLWRSGALSVTRRDGFQKIYDLTERVVPEAIRAERPDLDQSIDWLCNAALDRLGFATSGEIAAFWASVTPAEARTWCVQADLIEIDVEGADGSLKRCFARPGVYEEAMLLDPAPSRVRVLSPFDPALRDRKRAERLFGFHYRIEVFVPKAKRQYGYYVFPMLEGERLVGRIDMKARRDQDALVVTNIWWEPGVKSSKSRQAKLLSELERMTRFADVSELRFDGCSVAGQS